MKECIFEPNSNKRHKPERVRIPWAKDKGYVRFGVVGGNLDHGPMHAKNVCYLVSRSTGRRIRVRYRGALHPLMCSHIGHPVMITGRRYYDNSGTIDSVDARTIERNEMPQEELVLSAEPAVAGDDELGKEE